MNSPEVRSQEPKVRLLNRRVPDLWFRPKPWESEAFYRWIGVGACKVILPTSGDWVNKKFFHKNRRKETFLPAKNRALRYDYEARQNEVAHLLLSPIGLPFMYNFAVHGQMEALAVTIVAELGLFLYPAMVSRLARLKTYPIVEWDRRRRLPDGTPTRDMVN